MGNDFEKYDALKMDRLQSLRDQSWPEDTQPLISISCTVFNQIDYIENCIESFLNQKTSFPVEILIHDDFSTDGTAELVKKYESEYPALIRPIFQKENQFSKGKLVNEFNFKRAKGDYVALCHGDDFWIDHYKLEKQVSVMKKFGVGMCGHPATEVDTKGDDLKKLTGYQVENITAFDAKELIKNNGNMLPFGSIMITREVVNDMLEHMPPVRFHTGIQMLGAWRRGLVVMPDVMMAYRVEVPGSTTEIMLGDIDKRFKTTLLRVESIKYLKAMYGESHFFCFDLLLAKQVTFFVRRRFFGYGWAVFGFATKGARLSSIIAIASFSLLLSVKAVLSPIYKVATYKVGK